MAHRILVTLVLFPDLIISQKHRCICCMPGIWRKTDLFSIQYNVIEIVGTDRTGVVRALSGFIQATEFINEICPGFGTCGPPERGRVFTSRGHRDCSNWRTRLGRDGEELGASLPSFVRWRLRRRSKVRRTTELILGRLWPWQPHNRRWKRIGKSPRDADCGLGKSDKSRKPSSHISRRRSRK